MMFLFITLFLFNLNIDFNRGLITDEPIPSRTIMVKPIFSHSPLKENFTPLTNWSKRESLNLTLRGEYNLAGGYVNMSGWQVAPYQDYLLFSSGGGFYVFNVSETLTKIREVSGPGYIFDFEIKDTLIFCASADRGLVIFNFSDLSRAKWLNATYLSFEQPLSNPQYGWGATGIALKDTFAFITTRAGGLYVVNIADPNNPRIVATENTFTWLMDIVIKENIAFVTNYDPGDTVGLIAYDISNPLHPQVISYVGGNVRRGMKLFIKDTLAYIGARYYGFYIVNIADPRNMRLVSQATDLLEVQRVNVVNFGDTLYAFVSDIYGLAIYDVSDPQNPQLINQLNVRSTATYIDRNHRKLYDQALGGAVLYDITYPYNPQLINYYVYLGNPYYLTAKDNIAYLYDGYGMLRILDISQPNNITEIAYYDRYLESIPSGTWGADIGGIFYSNNYIYLIVRGFPWFCYLAIVDVSNPRNPQWVGTKMWRGYAGGNQFYVEDTLAFIPLAINAQTDLRIINIANPQRIRERGVYYWSTWAALEIAKYDTILFMAGGYDPWGGTQPLQRDLGILNVSDITNPVLITEYSTPNQCRGVDCFSYVPIIAVADWAGGVHTINITNPAAPQIIGTVDFENNIEDVHIGEQLIFTGDGYQFTALKTDRGQNLRLYGYYDMLSKFGYGGIVSDVWSRGDEYGYASTYGGFFIYYTGLSPIKEVSNSSKEFRLRIKIPGEYLITISDASGRIVFKEKQYLKENSSLRLPSLKNGLYFLRIKGKEEIQKKIVMVK